MKRHFPTWIQREKESKPKTPREKELLEIANSH